MPRTLFEKLIPSLVSGDASAGSGRSARWTLAESVRRHLIRLFNTHEGSAPGCPEYGLPDLRALSQLVRNDRAVVEELLRSRIAKFEPRLVGVEVRYVDPRDAVPGRGSASASAEDLFLAHFQVRGQLVEAGQGGQKLVNRGVFAMEMEQDAKGQIKLSSSRNS